MKFPLALSMPLSSTAKSAVKKKVQKNLEARKMGTGAASGPHLYTLCRAAKPARKASAGLDRYDETAHSRAMASLDKRRRKSTGFLCLLRLGFRSRLLITAHRLTLQRRL
jgi:hypothetical protein